MLAVQFEPFDMDLTDPVTPKQNSVTSTRSYSLRLSQMYWEIPRIFRLC